MQVKKIKIVDKVSTRIDNTQHGKRTITTINNEKRQYQCRQDNINH